MIKTIFITIIIIVAIILFLRDWGQNRITKKDIEEKMKKEDEELINTINLGKAHLKRQHNKD